MKNIIATFALLISGLVIGQNSIEPTYEVKDNQVLATFYYDNGQVHQQGTYNKEGKLDGKWISYDMNGNKISTGEYMNGSKIGNWSFWNQNKISQVTFEDSKIASINVISQPGLVDMD